MSNSIFDWPASLNRFARFTTAKAEEVNAALDGLSAGLDDVEGDIARALKLPIGTADQTLAMAPGQRAGLMLGFDSQGNITGVAGGGRYRGDWVTATAYAVSDYFRDPVTKNIYATVVAHTSDVLATDISAAKVLLAINVADAEAAVATATTQAGLAAASASSAAASKVAAQEAQAIAESVVATIPEGVVNDAATSLTDVWSSSKVSGELDGKQDAITSQLLSTAGATVNAVVGVRYLLAANDITLVAPTTASKGDYHGYRLMGGVTGCSWVWAATKVRGGTPGTLVIDVPEFDLFYEDSTRGYI